MEKFFYRLKGREGRSQLRKQKTDFTQTIHDPDGDSSKQVVDQQDPDLSPREAGPPVDPQDDIVTFTGRNIVELPTGQINVEILIIQGFPPGDYINLTLHRTKKPRCAEEFTFTIQGPWYMTFNQVAKLLKEHGYREPYSAKHATLAVRNWNEDKAMPTEFQICAVDGPSCYAEPGLLINRDESIGSFTDVLRQLRVRCKDGKAVTTSFPAELEITFHRTLRLPEEGELHYQSHRLCHIPVMGIASISRQLQNSSNASLTNMARKGGVFFTLYQREPMFLSFKATSDSFAIRSLVGGVNAISGLPWNSPVPRQLSKQDYLYVPTQKYLDGIAVGKKTVRQFVAMPLG
ncbi:integral membrane protein [Fusarium beomiforme]|uniref:Integral membrane protein n=1 Tax=Fusarium beomiforme TaxID=44412 RepID=A0A9P5A7V9_9HYPO|nr:integral membrane protein [Fusarium beomiforme]